ncbi:MULTISPECIES: hypothetical protein [Actinomadura]|uniref:Uncharacterized protein n=1 Tax=Actinomadura yumaensis TaxID=111807 RepID=A0ABW2CEQ4_9ACTN|nr:hypothetical protein [Actinomadura sp. J1-007]
MREVVAREEVECSVGISALRVIRVVEYVPGEMLSVLWNIVHLVELLAALPDRVGRERGPFVVEAEAVGGDLVKPDAVGAAVVGLGEGQDGGGDPGVGLEDAVR